MLNRPLTDKKVSTQDISINQFVLAASPGGAKVEKSSEEKATDAKKEYSPVLARTECCIMTSDTFSYDGKYFRYPALYLC